jgi:prophage antirepressor-like protein
MSALQVFQFDPANPLRGGSLQDGTPYMIAADVCKIAGHSNVSSAMARIDPDEKGLIDCYTPGGTQSLLYVTESGFYSLTLSFRVRPGHPNYELLRRFKRWVTHEVIPTIRRTGRYEVTPQPSLEIQEPPTAEMVVRQAEALLAQARLYAEHSRRLAVVETVAVETREIAVKADAKADAALVSIGGGQVGNMALVGYCNIHGLHYTARELARIGKGLSRLCRSRGIEVKRISHEMFGEINAYPVEVLDEWREALLQRA